LAEIQTYKPKKERKKKGGGGKKTPQICNWKQNEAGERVVVVVVVEVEE
jgi:hypothetical protein